MPQPVLSTSLLMDVSEMRIEDIRWSGSADERRVVSRLFETPATYSRWEAYHAGLMRCVGDFGTRRGQVAVMRRKRFELIHRQALFQYLRDSPIAGAEREAIMAAFHGTSDYRRAVVAEHGRFLQSNSSLFCAEHLASSIMQDARFGRGLETYRRRYMSFFSHFCGSILAESQGREFAARQVIPALKKELLVLRRDLLSLPVVTAATGCPVTDPR